MTIFDERNEIEQRIQAKCRRVWEMVNKIGDELDINIPYFSRGISFLVCPYVQNEYVDNPHYDPKLPHTPENRAKETGFPQICVEHQMINFNAHEFEDEYEDFGCDSYHLMIPKDAFFEVGDTQLETFIREHLQKEVDRNKRNERSSYTTVFDFDFAHVQKIINYCDVENVDVAKLDYPQKEAILKELGIMHHDD